MEYKPKFFRPVYEIGTAPRDAKKMLWRYHGVVFQETEELIPANLIDPSGHFSNQDDRIVFLKRGDYWEIGPPGKHDFYKHTKGLALLHYLMERPDQAVGNVALNGGGLMQKGVQQPPDKDQEYQDFKVVEQLKKVGKKQGFRSVNAVGDKRTLAEYKERLQEIIREKAELERKGRTASDPEWTGLDKDFRLIEAEINRQDFHDQGKERVRRNVSKHIHQAIEKIANDFPDLGRYLREKVQPKDGHQWIFRPGNEGQQWCLK